MTMLFNIYFLILKIYKKRTIGEKDDGNKQISWQCAMLRMGNGYSMLCIMLVTIIYINIIKISYENRLNVRATYEWRRVSKAKRPQQGPSMMANKNSTNHNIHSVCFCKTLYVYSYLKKSKAPTRWHTIPKPWHKWISLLFLFKCLLKCPFTIYAVYIHKLYAVYANQTTNTQQTRPNIKRKWFA